MEEQLRQAFKYLNRVMVPLWRLGLGPLINIWPSVGGQIMVIMHIGRKSGLRRYTPVNYALVDGELYCTAGFGKISDWYRNIKAHPQVEVWLPDGWWAGEVAEIGPGERRLWLLRQVLIGSGFAARLANINPHTITDAALAESTASYRLLHIHRTAPCTGRGGPGEYAWVWPVATMILLPLVLRRRRR